jgi:hypothetical protein
MRPKNARYYVTATAASSEERHTRSPCGRPNDDEPLVHGRQANRKTRDFEAKGERDKALGILGCLGCVVLLLLAQASCSATVAAVAFMGR